MDTYPSLSLAPLLLSALVMTTALPSTAEAHCDGVDGPVVTLAANAIDTGNVNLVLPWVPSEDETEIRRAFDHAMSVRKLGPEAARLADTFFFETLVRVHRASEGAPFTGLKPAGIDPGPAIPAADQALASGAAEAVETLLAEAIRNGLRERFHAVSGQKRFAVDDVAAGRRFVAAYVSYIHYVEGLWEAATGPASAPHAEPVAHAR